MTAQIDDTVIYRGRHYSIAGISGGELFDPEEQGLKLVAISTACWRGFYCTYEIAEGELLLRELAVGLDEEDRRAVAEGAGPLLFGVRPKKPEDDWSYQYEGLAEVVKFTGGLLLAAGFIEELYVHMGFHPSWKYREVHEVILEQGRVVKAMDRSAAMARFREELADRPLQPDSPDEVRQWIDQCFSREYRW